MLRMVGALDKTDDVVTVVCKYVTQSFRNELIIYYHNETNHNKTMGKHHGTCGNPFLGKTSPHLAYIANTRGPFADIV